MSEQPPKLPDVNLMAFLIFLAIIALIIATSVPPREIIYGGF